MFAKLQIVATYGYISSIVHEIGGDEVEISTLASSDSDPHFITPKPSFIAKLRNSDLLIKNGAELEDGWLLPLQKRAGNSKIIIGSSGYLNLAKKVKLIDIPENGISRRDGDVHAHGNPHFHLSPENIELISKVILNKLIELDQNNQEKYLKNFEVFSKKWSNFIKKLKTDLKPFKGWKVISYHRVYDYFLRYFNIELVETIEPIAGIPPSMSDISNLENRAKNIGIKIILTDYYHPINSAEYLSQKISVPYKVVPHDVKIDPNFSEDIFKLYEKIANAFKN
jgi:zinc/manganese transport system substrate-binding protein